MATWDEFAAGVPVLAAAIRDRFASNLHHVVGTIRPDGSPRLSGSEVTFAGGDAKLAGRLRRTGTVGDDEGFMFVLDLERASLVRVDGDELDITVWTPERGARTMRRK
mgnify:CR=1 FL=1